MNVKKYRDVCRLTFFGRNDKNLNDNTSIYSGFDRTLQINSGGGINGFNVVSTNTHATELVLERPGFFWPSYHRLDNSSSHVAD